MEPPSSPLISHAARSRAGVRRASNQDRYAVDDRIGLLFLADGVAGRPAGARAAEVAVSAARAHVTLTLAGRQIAAHDALFVLHSAFDAASGAVLRAAERDCAAAMMGTTLVGALFVDGHVAVGAVGDTRAYRLRAGQLEQLTTDHVAYPDVELAALNPSDVKALRPFTRRLTRLVGDDGPTLPDFFVMPTSSEELFLFCSNGAYDFNSDRKIADVLQREADLEKAAERLLGDSDDDATVVLVRPNFPEC